MHLNYKFLRIHNKKLVTSKLPLPKIWKIIFKYTYIELQINFHARTDKYYKNLDLKFILVLNEEIIEKEITTEYQEFELASKFNYSKPSRPRMGFSNIEPNMIIFINNPYFYL